LQKINEAHISLMVCIRVINEQTSRMQANDCASEHEIKLIAYKGS